MKGARLLWPEAGKRIKDQKPKTRSREEITAMQIQNVPFGVTEWERVFPTVYPGEAGVALWRTVEVGNIRVRMVEYTAGYIADHWCSRGHVLLVLEGNLVMELQSGEKYTMPPGTSFQVADDGIPHRAVTQNGAKVFIVD